MSSYTRLTFLVFFFVSEAADIDEPDPTRPKRKRNRGPKPRVMYQGTLQFTASIRSHGKYLGLALSVGVKLLYLRFLKHGYTNDFLLPQATRLLWKFIA